MDAAIYLRKSRAEEAAATEEDTLRRHKETLLKFASDNNLTILKIYEEVISGESLYARPRMLELLQDVENNAYDAVLCMDIDRLGRGAMSDQGVILETFKSSDTRIITLRKIYDLNNELDEEYTEFETFIARRELKLIKRRMQRGIQKTIEEGGYIANAPYGYQKVTRNNKPSLEIFEEEAQFVRMMFQWYCEDHWGSQMIADKLDQLGAKPHRSDKFNRNSVLKILRNQVYIGKIVWNQKTHVRKGSKGKEKHLVTYNPQEQWMIFDGMHPPIIEDELFNKTQSILKNRYHPPSNDGTLHNPLAGLVFCARCGKAMQRRKYNRLDSFINLLCPTNTCTPASPIEDVEKSVIMELELILSQFKSGKKTASTNKTEEHKETLRLINKELKASQVQKNRLHDFLEQGVYDIDTYLERSNIIKDKIEKLEQAHEEITGQIEQMNYSNITAFTHRLENMLDVYWKTDARGKNELLKSVVSKIVYYKDHGWKRNKFELQIFLRDVG